jgi:ATP-dependent exoDNAse (exonuclease V) beta subunit
VVDTSVDPQDGGGMNGGAEGDLDGAAADSGDGDPGRGGRGPKVNPDWCLWVAGRIRDLYQQCPSAGIGVLTRTNDSVARIVHELTRLGVPASEEGGTAPTDSAAVLALISVLQMAAHPGCTASRFHVSQSPLGPVLGLTDWRSDSLASRVAAQVRAQLLDDGYGPALQAWSDAVSPAFGARDRLRWQQVIAAAWEFDAQGSLNPAGFARRLRLSAFAKSTPAPVRVMTIHQSKGLEFPVVVLPELHSELSRAPQQAWGQPGPGEPPDRVCVWVNEKLRPLLPKRIREIFEQTQERNLAESLSVLYVALTRAQHSVHLLVPPTTASKPPKTFAGLLTVALTGNGQSVPLRTLYERGDREWFRRVPELQSRARSGGDAALPAQGEPAPVCRQVRLASMPDGRRRGLVRRTPSRHDESQLFLPGTGNAVAERRSRNSRGATPKPRTRTAGSTKPATSVATGFPIEPREKGLLWHAWFECLEWVPAKGAAASVIDVAALRARAAKLAMSEPVIEQALPEFLSGLDQPAVRSVFNEAVCGASEGLIRSRSATGVLEVSRERPFALLSDNEVVTGTMDRLVLLLDRGQPVAADIVDFKTDRVVGDPDAWLADRAKFYQPQLGEYRTAVATMFKLPPACISARLVFTEASRVVDVK